MHGENYLAKHDEALKNLPAEKIPHPEHTYEWGNLTDPYNEDAKAAIADGLIKKFGDTWHITAWGKEVLAKREQERPNIVEKKLAAAGHRADLQELGEDMIMGQIEDVLAKFGQTSQDCLQRTGRFNKADKDIWHLKLNLGPNKVFEMDGAAYAVLQALLNQLSESSKTGDNRNEKQRRKDLRKKHKK